MKREIIRARGEKFIFIMIITLIVCSSVYEPAAQPVDPNPKNKISVFKYTGKEWIRTNYQVKRIWAGAFHSGSWITMQILSHNGWISNESLDRLDKVPAPYTINSDELVDYIDLFYQYTGQYDYPVVYVAIISRWEETRHGLFNNIPWETIERYWLEQ